MFAADGTLYTEKLKKEDKIVKNDLYDNNKYEIVDPKVKMTYNALKKWHKSHMKLYDMIIDPISSPKAIDSTGEKSFYRSNSDFYSSINRSGQALCEKYNLNYDGKENPFIR